MRFTHLQIRKAAVSEVQGVGDADEDEPGGCDRWKRKEAVEQCSTAIDEEAVHFIKDDHYHSAPAFAPP